LQPLHSAAAASRNTYWQITLAIACCPLHAGQTDVVIDRHDKETADFRDIKRAYLSKNY